MKSISFNQSRALIALGISAALMMGYPVYAIGKPVNSISIPHNPGEDEPTAAPAKANSKTSSSRNNNAVKIYPDILKRSMHVVAKDNKGKEIDFFVFDLQGNLVQNFKMKERDHQKLGGLARGKYVYRVFSGDHETACGEFEIR